MYPDAMIRDGQFVETKVTLPRQKPRYQGTISEESQRSGDESEGRISTRTKWYFKQGLQKCPKLLNRFCRRSRIIM